MYSKIWLSEPHFENDDFYSLKETFESNWISTIGPNINKFEESIESFLGNNSKVVALNSGTSAIHIALKLLDVGFGDEVICQSFTFCATANPILYCGAIPVFIDSEKDTWNMCPNFLEEAIKNRLSKNIKPKAIIIVDSYGMPAKWGELIAISKKYEIPIIEDSAEALGSMYKNKMCGTFGDFSVLSFNGNKIITTSAGGALICKNNKEKKRAIYLSTQSKNSDNFIHNEIGYNYRMSNVLAGIGQKQINVLKKRIDQRRLNYENYKNSIKRIEGVYLKNEPTSEYYSNFWLNCILIESQNYSKFKLLKEFSNYNIDSRSLWYPLHLQDYLKDALFFGEGICEKLFNKGLCLPSSSSLSKKDFSRVIKVLNLFNN